MFDSEVIKTFHYLNRENAKTIISICKKHGANIQRLAEGRKLLGVIKVNAKFNKYLGWLDNSNSCKKAMSEILKLDIITSITF